MSAESDNGQGIAWEASVPPQASTPSSGSPSGLLEEHPEALAGAAFVGGLLTALIVRRLGR
jgi:hypothetical protein